MADENLMSQDEIERLLNQAKNPGPAATPAVPAAAAAPTPSGAMAALEDALAGMDASLTGTPPETAQSPQTSEIPDSGDAGRLLGQDDIEKLLNQSGAAKKAPAPPPAAKPEPREAAAATATEDGLVPQGDIDYLLNQAERALESINADVAAPLPAGLSSFALEEFGGAPPSAENTTIDLIRDVELDLKIELGRTHMYLEDVLRLRRGSVVPLDKLAGDPVDIFVNGRLIARGEVLVLNDNFCVRVAELIAGHNPVA